MLHFDSFNILMKRIGEEQFWCLGAGEGPPWGGGIFPSKFFFYFLLGEYLALI